jgi:hypothetical protein
MNALIQIRVNPTTYSEKFVGVKVEEGIMRWALMALLYASLVALTIGTASAQAVPASFRAANEGDNPFNLNFGLFYFDMDNFELARKLAHVVLQLGLNSPILKDHLTKVVKWTEPNRTDPSVNATRQPDHDSCPKGVATRVLLEDARVHN